MTEKNMDPVTIHCRECPAGVMHKRSITYFTWLGSELITVPDFPAWVCDFCGKREYDERAVSMVAMILNPEAGRAQRRVKFRSNADAPPPKFTQPRTTSGR